MPRNTSFLTGLIAIAQITLSGSILLLSSAIHFKASFWGALESTALISGATVAAGIATSIFIALKKEINSHFMARSAEAFKFLNDINFLIYLVGAYALSLALALMTVIAPWAGTVGITAANVLLVIQIIMVADLPRRIFILNNACDMPVSNAQVIIVLTATALFIASVVLYGLTIDHNPVGLQPGENAIGQVGGTGQ
ncbi:hypothetical protein [Methyloglobulus sp.]|uniref:hypothetical protein n=1 Tax=Methyloglobulus sp. TaxID=2518622 RepID=UPI0032B74AA5